MKYAAILSGENSSAKKLYTTGWGGGGVERPLACNNFHQYSTKGCDGFKTKFFTKINSSHLPTIFDPVITSLRAVATIKAIINSDLYHSNTIFSKDSSKARLFVVIKNCCDS